MGFISHAYVCPRIAGGFGIFGFSIIVEVALVGYLGVGYSGFALPRFEATPGGGPNDECLATMVASGVGSSLAL